MSRFVEVCKVNMSFVTGLIGFNITILALLFSFNVSWSWIMDGIGALLAISVFCLTYSFFTYHTALASKPHSSNSKNRERLIQKGNRFTTLGLFSFILTVPLFLWIVDYYIAFGVSVGGIVFLLYRFLERGQVI